jgi:hypothetical protein
MVSTRASRRRRSVDTIVQWNVLSATRLNAGKSVAQNGFTGDKEYCMWPSHDVSVLDPTATSASPRLVQDPQASQPDGPDEDVDLPASQTFLFFMAAGLLVVLAVFAAIVAFGG